MITCALVISAEPALFKLPKALNAGLDCHITPPLSTPSTVIEPSGPASNVAGCGLALSGPAMAGLAIGVGAGGAGAAGVAGAVSANAAPAKARPSVAEPAQSNSFKLVIDYPLYDYAARPLPIVALSRPAFATDLPYLRQLCEFHTAEFPP